MSRLLPAPAAGQRATRLLVALMPLVAALCTIGSGEPPPAWLIALILTLSVGWAAFPESAAGATVLVTVLSWWGIGLRDGLTYWALPATAALLTAHIAATIASYGPARMPISRTVTALWAKRAALCYTACLPVYALAVLVRDVAPPPGVWSAGLAAAFVATTAASVFLTMQPTPQVAARPHK